MKLLRGRRRTAVAAIAVVLALGVAAVIVLLQRREEPPPSVSLRAGEVGVRVQATRWCPEGKKCQTHRRGIPVLRLRTVSDVLIEVDDRVSRRPWLVLVDGTNAGPLQRRSTSYRLRGVTAPLLVEVVTVDTDGRVVLQRDRWIFKIENRQ